MAADPTASDSAATDAAAAAAVANPDARRLGEYLPVSQSDLQVVLEQLKPKSRGSDSARAVEPIRVGEALVEAGLVTREQLFDAVYAQRADRLRRCPLFASLTDAELAGLAEQVSEASVAPNEQFIEQDTVGGSMFVIAAGRVMVYRRTEDGEEIALGAAWPGETIGEMGFFSDGTRSASARALEPVQLLEIPYTNLPRCFDVAPNLARDFLRIVTKRLRETNVRYQANVNKRRVVERSLRHLSAYLDLSSDMAIGAGIESLIDRVVRSASKVMQADRASLFLVDPVTGDLWSKVAEGDDGKRMKEIRVPAGSGIAGWVAQHGETLNIADAYEDDRFNQANDVKTGYRTRSVLCGPVLNLQGAIVGVIQVINKESGKFEPEDETLFRAFAHQAAIAVENFNLYRRLVASNEKMAIMLDVANSVSQTLDLPSLIRKIVQKTTEILHCDRGSFFVLDRDAGELFSMEASGAGVKEIRFPVAIGLAGHCARTGEVVNVVDAHEDRRFNPEFDKKTGYRTRSVLCVPVIGRDGKVTGVTQAINKVGGAAFEEGDVELLKAISAQIAVAVENAQLYARTVHMKNYLASVQESISNGIVTLDDAYKVVTANGAALRTLERQADAVVGMDIRGVLGERNGRLLSMVDRAYADHKLVDEDDFELFPASEKTCTVNARALPLTDLEGRERGQVLVIEDITTERRVKNTLTRYMSRDIVEKILKDGEQQLGGVSNKATVLFSDIREFTTISEGLAAEKVMDFLNQYFTLMVDEVLRHDGVLDKYMGDALMAVFGVPYPAPDDAVRGVRAALSMVKALDEFNARRAAAGLPIVHMGIGINTDSVVSGRMGSAKRMEYTVIGDGVNIASRLEGLTKQYGAQVLVTETTVRELGDHFYVREVDHVRMKGKVRPVGIYEVLGDAAYKPTAEQKLFEQGYEAYCQRQFQLAREAFHAGAKRDPACGIFLARCDAFLASPPPADWDGVWRATAK
jgi:adenylate cyclase